MRAPQVMTSTKANRSQESGNMKSSQWKQTVGSGSELLRLKKQNKKKPHKHFKFDIHKNTADADVNQASQKYLRTAGKC